MHRTLTAAHGPMILLGTLLTHLVGGSAGREGTAVQMGAALADQLTRWSGWARQHRRHKTPVASIIMAMELFGHAIGWHAALACAVAVTVSGAHGIYRPQPKPSALTCP